MMKLLNKLLQTLLLISAIGSTIAFSFSAKPMTFWRIRSTAPSMPVSTNHGEAVSSHTEGKKSLEEFNAFCQQIIAEERQHHYDNFLVSDCVSRRCYE